jgi:hypothetical protein
VVVRDVPARATVPPAAPARGTITSSGSTPPLVQGPRTVARQAAPAAEAEEAGASRGQSEGEDQHAAEEAGDG